MIKAENVTKKAVRKAEDKYLQISTRLPLVVKYLSIYQFSEYCI